MIFHIFIALILISRKTIVPYGLILFLNLVGFTLASTRGAFLGLVFGTALSIFLFVFFYLKPSKKTILIYSAAISTVITLSCCVFVFTDSELYWPIKRLINISSNDPAILARLHNIGIALQGIQERPWLGWGQENYEVVFNRYFDPRLVTAEPWFDRVHNHIFDWAIAGGILGLFGYISIFVAALWVLWKNKSFNIKEQCLVTGVFFSYFVNNLALFDTITSYLMFAILLSWLISKSSSYPKHSLSSGMPYLRAFACSTIAFILIYSFNLKPFTQLQTYSRGLITSNLNERLALFDDALKTHSLGQKEIAYYLCSNAFELVLNNSAPIRTRQKYHEKCQEQLLFLQDKEPLNMVIPLYLGIQQTILGNPEAADTFLSLAHELSPKKQIVLWEMARNNELALNNPEKAEKLFKKAFELYEDAPKSRTMYGAFLVRQGQDQQAESILKPLIANGQAAAPEVLEAYRMRGNESKITELLHK
jgi:O-antigen ligase